MLGCWRKNWLHQINLLSWLLWMLTRLPFLFDFTDFSDRGINRFCHNQHLKEIVTLNRILDHSVIVSVRNGVALQVHYFVVRLRLWAAIDHRYWFLLQVSFDDNVDLCLLQVISGGLILKVHILFRVKKCFRLSLSYLSIKFDLSEKLLKLLLFFLDFFLTQKDLFRFTIRLRRLCFLGDNMRWHFV